MEAVHHLSGQLPPGDFGVSYTKAGLTVNKVIADGFPFSTIGIYASLVVVFAGILFGSVCAAPEQAD